MCSPVTPFSLWSVLKGQAMGRFWTKLERKSTWEAHSTNQGCHILRSRAPMPSVFAWQAQISVCATFFITVSLNWGTLHLLIAYWLIAAKQTEVKLHQEEMLAIILPIDLFRWDSVIKNTCSLEESFMLICMALWLWKWENRRTRIFHCLLYQDLCLLYLDSFLEEMSGRSDQDKIQCILMMVNAMIYKLLSSDIMSGYYLF